MSALLTDVSDTALLTAYHRALETDRPDALFRDRFARGLAGERGKRIAEGMPAVPGAHPGPRGLSWGLAVRTHVFDEFILDAIRAIGATAVLNLAAGFDARPYRLPLPRDLVWIEADRASVLDAKASALAGEAPACALERIAVDLGDGGAREALFDRVAAAHARVVVVTEGLLVYLDEAAVTSLSRALRRRPCMQRWVLESVAPEMAKQTMKAWGPVLAPAKATWKFAPSSGFDFFRPLGWSLLAARAALPEARRLGRDDLRFRRLLHALAAVSTRFRRRLEGLVAYGVVAPAA
jgi:methyltransferase (TIGR00027 family)